MFKPEDADSGQRKVSDIIHSNSLQIESENSDNEN